MEPLWAPAPWPFFGTRRRHKYRVKPGSAALVLSSLPLCLSFCFLSFALPANCLAAASLLTAAFLSLPPQKRWAENENPKTQMSCWLEPKRNGYRRGEHREQEAALNRHAHVDTTKYDQDGALRRYVVYEGPSLLVYK
jgi:hypothetical protein